MENSSAAPNTSKLPALERKVDHLSTLVTATWVAFLLPLPLLLVFGAKALAPMGLVICLIAIVRFINSPVQLQVPTQASEPVTAAKSVASAPQDGAVSSATAQAVR